MQKMVIDNINRISVQQQEIREQNQKSIKDLDDRVQNIEEKIDLLTGQITEYKQETKEIIDEQKRTFKEEMKFQMDSILQILDAQKVHIETIV